MGKVVFSTVIIRLDNIQAVSKLVEFLINPDPNYMKVMDYNICYLVSNKYLAIEYKAENKDNKLIAVINKVFTAATNTSYGNNPNRRSGEGHIFKLFKGVIN